MFIVGKVLVSREKKANKVPGGGDGVMKKTKEGEGKYSVGG